MNYLKIILCVTCVSFALYSKTKEEARLEFHMESLGTGALNGGVQTASIIGGYKYVKREYPKKLDGWLMGFMLTLANTETSWAWSQFSWDLDADYGVKHVANFFFNYMLMTAVELPIFWRAVGFTRVPLPARDRV